MGTERAVERCNDIVEEVSSTIVADSTVLGLILVVFLSRGHVLLEDVPGTGKTLTARRFANGLGLSFSRIQFTPDLLPTEVSDTHVFNEKTREFEFQEGPIFANIVLADEINRASPKTQAALLEAMEEGQVTIDGETRDLADPCFVIATQNPVEQEGTFELPEAQKDRFLVKTQIGYPDEQGELEIMRRRADRSTRTPTVGRVISEETVSDLQAAPESVTGAEDIQQFIADVVRATCEDTRVKAGVSPRGTQRLFEAARATAASQGREYVTPDDVTWLAKPVLAHRLVLTPDARVNNVDERDVIGDIVEDYPVPTVDYGAPPAVNGVSGR